MLPAAPAGSEQRAAEPEFVLRGSLAPVNCVAFHTELPLLFSGCASGQLRRWDLATYRCAGVAQAHSEAGVLSLQWNGTQLLSHGRDGRLCLWADPETIDACSTPRKMLDTHSMTFCRATVVSHDVVAVGHAADQTAICIWSLSTCTMTRTLTPDQREKQGMAMCSAPVLQAASQSCSDPGVLLAVGYESGLVLLWNPETGAAVSSVQHRVTSQAVLAIACPQVGVPGVVASADAFVSFVRVDVELVCDEGQPGTSSCTGTGTGSAADQPRSLLTQVLVEDRADSRFKLVMIGTHPLAREGCGAVAVRHDGRLIVTGGWDRRVRVFHARTLTPLAVMRHHTDSVYDVAFSPVDGVIATAGKDAEIALWRVFPL